MGITNGKIYGSKASAYQVLVRPKRDVWNVDGTVLMDTIPPLTAEFAYHGGEFKFHDYFASVRKHRYPVKFDPAAQPLTVDVLLKAFEFDGRPITFDYAKLLGAAPFLKKKSSSRA